MICTHFSSRLRVPARLLGLGFLLISAQVLAQAGLVFNLWTRQRYEMCVLQIRDRRLFCDFGLSKSVWESSGFLPAGGLQVASQAGEVYRQSEFPLNQLCGSTRLRQSAMSMFCRRLWSTTISCTVDLARQRLCITVGRPTRLFDEGCHDISFEALGTFLFSDGQPQ